MSIKLLIFQLLFASLPTVTLKKEGAAVIEDPPISFTSYYGSGEAKQVVAANKMNIFF